ncbi:related to putative phosphotransferase [Saccharomycodes ludwigii]|uniref:Related to putative phosphotransferase n=1 Tax=Saccharomycodes ludwigii TaxID=36035 RepID=A0A376B0W5_9ASCO|nr:hypothetical protein SCDLUD_001693 [Saccharomycodes ludwigii]KAH3901909.1 hypothetical protein SCDLUD_001693 [Saccharomycodes ludwigii]SSD58282.1 related to putative phosphotransferase [Saccharomycodes ludwigii]
MQAPDGICASHASLSLLHKKLLQQTANASSSTNLVSIYPELNQYYIGVDVGTGSARACIIDSTGNILSLSERPIQKEMLVPNYITQSSTEIWHAICHCVRNCVKDSGVDKERIHGIGFDATCSLVVIDRETHEEIGIGPNFQNNDQNIILWMDHRAVEETKMINRTGSKVLKYVGGQMSIEMEIPKIKWLQNNLPAEVFAKCEFFDLADYLTFKATGKKNRSYCSTVCKQGLLPIGVEGSVKGWDVEFLNEIGLQALCEDNFAKLGGDASSFLSAGEFVGIINEEVAKELGITTNCVVGSGVIDAYAGWIGTVAAKADVDIPQLVELDKNKKGISIATGRLAAVAGTSTCHIAMSEKPIFVQGVWGPYRDVMAKNYWLAEGGQSCTGALLAHVLSTHSAFTELAKQADTANVSRFDFLNSRLEYLKEARGERSVVSLARHLFFYGDYHGNRSPIADPNMRAAIIGQSMDNSIDDLAIMYLGACEFIAQQTRQIVETMCESGHDLRAIFLSGGQCRNGLLMRLLADCTGLPIIIPRYIDAAVVFGSALLGAVASKYFDKERKEKGNTPAQSRRRMSLLHKQVAPNNPAFAFMKKGQLLDSTFSVDNTPSPYTAPTATASTSHIVGSAYPFPNMNDYFDGASSNDSLWKKSYGGEEEEDDDGLLSFDTTAKTNNQKELEKDKFLSSGEILWDVMVNLTGGGKVVVPNDKEDPDRKLLDVKYQIFLDMANTQREYRKKVDEVESLNKKMEDLKV